MSKRKPRIISKEVEAKTARKRTGMVSSPSSYVVPQPKKPKTRAEEVYDIIEDACSDCWRFTDADGRPWIDKDNVEDKGDGIFVVRFRCPVTAMNPTMMFERMAEVVCSKLRSKLRYIFELKEQRYIGDMRQTYEECAWILKEGELDEEEASGEEDNEYEECESRIDSQEEIEGDIVDESTAEEVDERFRETIENFV